MSRSRPSAFDLLLRRDPRRADAFTLVELMVVIGIIGVMVASLGFALGDSGGSGLATAQRELATLAGTARAQAAVYSTEARLCIYATPPPTGDAEKYLRLAQVFRNSTPESATATWVPVGNPIYLPRGVYFVPTSVTSLLATGVTWPANPSPLSTVNTAFNPGQPVGTAFNGGTAFWLGYTADGTLSFPAGSTYAKLVVATAALTNNSPRFNNASAIRGLLLRPAGGVTMVNDAANF